MIRYGWSPVNGFDVHLSGFRGCAGPTLLRPEQGKVPASAIPSRWRGIVPFRQVFAHFGAGLSAEPATGE
jgi:hypothetical protein